MSSKVLIKSLLMLTELIGLMIENKHDRRSVGG